MKVAMKDLSHGQHSASVQALNIIISCIQTCRSAFTVFVTQTRQFGFSLEAVSGRPRRWAVFLPLSLERKKTCLLTAACEEALDPTTSPAFCESSVPSLCALVVQNCRTFTVPAGMLHFQPECEWLVWTVWTMKTSSSYNQLYKSMTPTKIIY